MLTRRLTGLTEHDTYHCSIDADLAGKPFFPGLIEYMNSGPICAMVWEGRDAVKTGRGMYPSIPQRQMCLVRIN